MGVKIYVQIDQSLMLTKFDGEVRLGSFYVISFARYVKTTLVDHSFIEVFEKLVLIILC